MIRSEADPRREDRVQPWKRVPVGMRVSRHGDGGRKPHAIAATLRTRTQSGTGDLLRIGATTLYWGTRDAFRPRPRRERVLRLTAY